MNEWINIDDREACINPKIEVNDSGRKRMDKDQKERTEKEEEGEVNIYIYDSLKLKFPLHRGIVCVESRWKKWKTD